MALVRVTGKAGIRVFSGATESEALEHYEEQLGCKPSEDTRTLSFDFLKPSELIVWLETGETAHL